MDNRKISIQSKGRKSFDLAFQLMFTNTWSHKTEQKATHYVDHPVKGLILLDQEDKNINSVPLLTPLDWKGAADLAWNWLSNQPDEKYQDHIDHDGSMGKGFRVYNEDWGHVAGSHYAILGLVPVYAWYGK